ncbi:hypothetical protein A4A49_19382 [Nicotiana attenuata]|uniref:Uncharacterized protein n=1 Tax=Nicotiana attenuata TaxID=49451 RepID=A0A314KS67_NICAT|nr:hypothetical protein A4A49_19382 [Nicotiana attenuata]
MNKKKAYCHGISIIETKGGMSILQQDAFFFYDILNNHTLCQSISPLPKLTLIKQIVFLSIIMGRKTSYGLSYNNL